MTNRPANSAAVTISMPKALLDAVDQAAAAGYMDRSTFIRNALARSLRSEPMVRESPEFVELPPNTKPIRYPPQRKPRKGVKP